MEELIFPILMAVGALGSLYGGYRSFWRKRLIENVPTSKCEGVTMGLTELHGDAVNLTSLTSYLAEKAVVYYRFTVEEQWRKTETYRDSKGNTRTRTTSGWRTVRSGEQRPRFELRDDTGKIRIDPDRAEMDTDLILSTTCSPGHPLYYGKGPRGAIAHSTFRRRFQEWAICPGQPIYVMGTSRVREDIVAPEIAYDPQGRMFLISTKSEDELVRSYTWMSVAGFGASVVLATFFAPVLYMVLHAAEFGQAIAATILWMILGAGVFSMTIVGLYLKTIYNGLVDLRYRAQRAWSMIDVELKRRHDLIPNLVSVVSAVADHEKETLEAVVQARQGVHLGQAPSAQGRENLERGLSHQRAALEQVFMLAEAYPRLKSDAAYLRLMEELTRCENRLALARSFYNDSVTNLNIRVETLPDSLFASMARAQRGLLLSAMEFETKPVTITFEEEVEEVVPTSNAFEDVSELEAVEPPAEAYEAVEARQK
jgi:hypothetical protein